MIWLQLLWIYPWFHSEKFEISTPTWRFLKAPKKSDFLQFYLVFVIVILDLSLLLYYCYHIEYLRHRITTIRSTPIWIQSGIVVPGIFNMSRSMTFSSSFSFDQKRLQSDSFLDDNWSESFTYNKLTCKPCICYRYNLFLWIYYGSYFV